MVRDNEMNESLPPVNRWQVDGTDMHGTGGLGGGGAERRKLTNSGVRSYSATRFGARRRSIEIETKRPAAAEFSNRISNLPCQSIESAERRRRGTAGVPREP